MTKEMPEESSKSERPTFKKGNKSPREIRRFLSPKKPSGPKPESEPQTPRVIETPPPPELPAITSRNLRPDVDPLRWYIDRVQEAEVDRSDPLKQRAKIADKVARSSGSMQEHYNAILSLPDRLVSQAAFYDDLFAASNLIRQTEGRFRGQNALKATAVRNYVAPLVEYQKIFKDQIDSKLREFGRYTRGASEAVFRMFGRERDSTIDNLVISDPRIFYKDIRLEQLVSKSPIDEADVHEIPNANSSDFQTVVELANSSGQNVVDKLGEIKRDFASEFGPQANVSTQAVLRAKAMESFRNYFHQQMDFWEAQEDFPGGQENTNYSRFLKNMDPELFDEYYDSQFFTDGYNKFRKASGDPEGLMRVAEQSGPAVWLGINILKNKKYLQETETAFHLLQRRAEAAHYQYQIEWIDSTIDDFKDRVDPDQIANLRNRKEGFVIRLKEAKADLPNIENKFIGAITKDGQIQELGPADQIRATRALRFAQRLRRFTGLEASLAAYAGFATRRIKVDIKDENGTVTETVDFTSSLDNTTFTTGSNLLRLAVEQEGESGRLDEGINKVFNFFERGVTIKMHPNLDKIIGTGFDSLFITDFFDGYAKGLFERTIKDALNRNNKEVNDEVRELLLRLGWVGDVSDFDPKERFGAYWETNNKWGRKRFDLTNLDFGALLQAGGPTEVGTFAGWVGDLMSADKYAGGIDTLLKLESVKPEDVEKALHDQKGQFLAKYVFVPKQDRITRFFMGWTTPGMWSRGLQFRETTQGDIYTNEQAVKQIKQYVEGAEAFQKEHFEAYLGFIMKREGGFVFPKYSSFSELAKTPLTLRERSMIVLNLLGGDVKDSQGNVLVTGKQLVEAYLNRTDDGELLPQNQRLHFEQFLAYAGLVFENGRVRFATKDEIQEEKRYVTTEASGKKIFVTLNNNLRHAIELRLRSKIPRLQLWSDFEQFITGDAAKRYLGLDFVPSEKLSETLRTYYLILENIRPQLGYREVGPDPLMFADLIDGVIPTEIEKPKDNETLAEKQARESRDVARKIMNLSRISPITQQLVTIDPMRNILHGNWFEWSGGGGRSLPLRLHLDVPLMLQELFIDKGPEMQELLSSQPWREQPTPADWRMLLLQLESSQLNSALNRDEVEVLSLQFRATPRNVFVQKVLQSVANIPDERGHLVGEKFETTRKGIIGRIAGVPGQVGGFFIPKLVPPGWETVTQFGLAAAGLFVVGPAVGAAGPFLLGVAGWALGNDYKVDNAFLPGSWLRMFLKWKPMRNVTIPGTDIVASSWDWPYEPENVAKFIAQNKIGPYKG